MFIILRHAVGSQEKNTTCRNYSKSHEERAFIMDDLYKWIEDKCKERGIKVSKLCSDIGIRQSVLSDLKHGRTKTLSVSTAGKLATYFGVDILEFLDYANEDSVNDYYDGWKDAQETFSITPELADYLDVLKNRPEMRMLFDVSKNATKEQIESIVHFIEGLSK